MCPNCGSMLYNGICSWCQEELFILENQSEYVDYENLTKDFIDKANEQKEEVKQRRKSNIKYTKPDKPIKEER